MMDLFESSVSRYLLAFALTYLLHSTIWILVVGGMVRLTVFQTPAVRNFLWKAAIIGGLISSTFCFTDQPIFLRSTGQPLAATTTAEEPIRVNSEAVGPERVDLPGPADSATEASAAQAPPAFQPSLGEKLPGYLAVLWAVVTFILLSRAFLQHWFFLRRTDPRQLVDHPNVIRLLKEIMQKTGLRTRPLLTQSPLLYSPVLIRRREVCLPEKALETMDATALEAMLAHELAHIARNDFYWTYGLTVLRRLFFFQPLLRLAIKEIEVTNELLCDRWAAQATGNHLALAQCLVTVAEWIKEDRRPYVLVAGMSLRKSELTNRISSLINLPDMKKNHFGLMRAGFSCFGVLVLAIAALPGFSLEEQPAKLAAKLTAIEVETPPSADGCALLLRAVKNNRIDQVHELVKKNDPNCEYRKDGEPRSALNAAARLGNVGIAKVLLQAGADVEFRATGDEGALMGAARYGHLEFVQLMIDSGAKVNKQVSGDGTALINAVRGGHYEVAKYLLENGADPMQNSPGDENPIYHASVKGSEMLKLVMKYVKSE